MEQLIPPLSEKSNFDAIRSVSTFDNVKWFTVEVDFNYLATYTLLNLGVDAPPWGGDKQICERLEILLKNPPQITIFANPQSAVIAPEPSKDFIKIARKAQIKWLMQLSSIFGSDKRRKRLQARLCFLIRQLEFTGVMIEAGKHRRHDVWHKEFKTPS